MKQYMDINSGEIWTKEEIKTEFEMFKYEMDPEPENFEDWFEDRLSEGRQGIGGIVEI